MDITTAIVRISKFRSEPLHYFNERKNTMFRSDSREHADRSATEPSLTSEIISPNSFGRKAMKRLIICTAVLGLAFSSAAQAKGCIKGAIVGGVAGSVAGHGKVGAAAGCVIGHHEANKAGAEKVAPQTTAPAK
jgi:hypothetical protein